MTLARAFLPSPDLCCLPSPHRILQGVAGMAFNFSSIELSHHPARKLSLVETPQPELASASLR